MRFVDTKHSVLISPTDSKLVDALLALGVDVITTEPLRGLYDNEKYHADMQCLEINGRYFIPEDCKYLNELLLYRKKNVQLCANLGRKYPNNVSLNALLIDGKLFCKESALNEYVREYCKEAGIEIISVNQGYTKCSVLALGNSAIITSDPTIHKAATANDISSLKISSGNIYLENADYGFIGGASGVVGDTVLFFGDVFRHPDAEEIISFIEQMGFNYVCLTNETLHDVGGLIII